MKRNPATRSITVWVLVPALPCRGLFAHWTRAKPSPVTYTFTPTKGC